MPDIRDLLVNRNRIRAYELLDQPDIGLMAGNLLGPAYDRLERSLRTGTAITVVDDHYVTGHECRPHGCDVARSTLAIDTRTGRIPATVVDETGRTVNPSISTWPKAVAAATTERDGRLLGLTSGGVPVRSRAAPRHDVVDLSTIDGRVIYDHGGSEVLIDHDRRLIVYSRPKPPLDGIVDAGSDSLPRVDYGRRPTSRGRGLRVQAWVPARPPPPLRGDRKLSRRGRIKDARPAWLTAAPI